MFSNDHSTAVQTKPTKQSVVSTNRSYATAGSAQNDTTVLTNDFINTVSDELLNVVDAGGLTPDKDNDNQLLQAIQQIIADNSKDIITNGSMAIDQRRNGSPINTTINQYNFVVDRVLNLRNAPNQTEIRKQAWSGNNFPEFDYCGQIRTLTPYVSTSQTDFDTGFMYILEKNDLESLYDKPLTISFKFRSNVVGKFSAGYYMKNNGGQWSSYITQFTIDQVDVDQEISVTLPPISKQSNHLLPANGRALHIMIGGLAGASLDRTVDDVDLDTVIVGDWKAGATTSVNWQLLANNYIQMTGLQIDIGTQPNPFQFESYHDALSQSQRYFEAMGRIEYKGTSTAEEFIHIPYKSTKRDGNIVVLGTVTNMKTGVVGSIDIPLTDLGHNDLSMVVSVDSNGIVLRNSKAVGGEYHFVIDNLFISNDLSYTPA